PDRLAGLRRQGHRQVAGRITRRQVEHREDYEADDQQGRHGHQHASDEELRQDSVQLPCAIGGKRKGERATTRVDLSRSILDQSARYQSAMFQSSESHEFFAVPMSELARAETSPR